MVEDAGGELVDAGVDVVPAAGGGAPADFEAVAGGCFSLIISPSFEVVEELFHRVAPGHFFGGPPHSSSFEPVNAIEEVEAMCSPQAHHGEGVLWPSVWAWPRAVTPLFLATPATGLLVGAHPCLWKAAT